MIPSETVQPCIAALIVAAGRGSRAGAGLPKQYRLLAGRSVLARSLDAFLGRSGIALVRVVIDAADESLYRDAVAGLGGLGPPVPGGATRQDSVRAGLEALAGDGRAPDIVLIHDAARPFVSADLVARALAAIAGGAAAAVPAVPVVDTIKEVDGDGHVRATPDRARLRAVQTPQAFAFPALLEAHRKAAAAGEADVTDDAMLMERMGHRVATFPGDPANAKLTYAEDFCNAERRLAAGSPMNDVRIGQGYDVHAFGPGDHVWLGGVRIAHARGVLAHSDGDVVLHAATDALLGALAEGDIGTHFPPSDPQWRGASSDRFLAHAGRLLAERSGLLAHLDLTVVCEAPRIGPYRAAIRARIAAILGVAEERVSIKATTSEKMGFTGRGEGLAAWAVATIRLPGG